MGCKTSGTVYDRAAKARKRNRAIAAQREYWKDIRWRGMVNADTALLGRVPDYVQARDAEPELPATAAVAFRDAARIG